MSQEKFVTVSKKFGQHVKPRLHSPQTPSSSSLLAQILNLDEKVHELQETADKLDYILVQHTDALDEIAHNQVVIDNCLNRIETLLTSHISEVH